jgi:hypothetical protein
MVLEPFDLQFSTEFFSWESAGRNWARSEWISFTVAALVGDDALTNTVAIGGGD